MDAAGVVDALGPRTDGRLKVGDKVVAIVLPTSPTKGAYAEQIVVPTASVVPMPAQADFAAASALLMNGLTARLALDALAAIRTCRTRPAGSKTMLVAPVGTTNGASTLCHFAQTAVDVGVRNTA